MIERSTLLSHQYLAQSRNSKLIIFRILRLCNAVAEEYQRVVRLQLDGARNEGGFWKKTNRKRTSLIKIADLTTPQQQRRWDAPP